MEVTGLKSMSCWKGHGGAVVAPYWKSAIRLRGRAAANGPRLHEVGLRIFLERGR